MTTIYRLWTERRVQFPDRVQASCDTERAFGNLISVVKEEKFDNRRAYAFYPDSIVNIRSPVFIVQLKPWMAAQLSFRRHVPEISSLIGWAAASRDRAQDQSAAGIEQVVGAAGKTKRRGEKIAGLNVLVKESEAVVVGNTSAAAR